MSTLATIESSRKPRASQREFPLKGSFDWGTRVSKGKKTIGNITSRANAELQSGKVEDTSDNSGMQTRTRSRIANNSSQREKRSNYWKKENQIEKWIREEGRSSIAHDQKDFTRLCLRIEYSLS